MERLARTRTEHTETETSERLINYAFSNRGQIDLDRNTEGLENARVSNARQLENLGAVDRAGGHDYFATRLQRSNISCRVDEVLDLRRRYERTRRASDDLARESARDEFQVGARDHGLVVRLVHYYISTRLWDG